MTDVTPATSASDKGTAMTELQKQAAGLPYHFLDAEVAARKERAVVACRAFNEADPTDHAERDRLARALLGSAGADLSLQSPFHCDDGANIHVGDGFLTNFSVTILDIAEVRTGDRVMIGPNCLISTVGHPLSRSGRAAMMAQATPVTIGDDVWLGGNVTVLPGVTIGDGVVVAAGAVVTRDVPAHCVVAGVPAKVVRELDA